MLANRVNDSVAAAAQKLAELDVPRQDVKFPQADTDQALPKLRNVSDNNATSSFVPPELSRCAWLL